MAKVRGSDGALHYAHVERTFGWRGVGVDAILCGEEEDLLFLGSPVGGHLRGWEVLVELVVGGTVGGFVLGEERGAGRDGTDVDVPGLCVRVGDDGIEGSWEEGVDRGRCWRIW